MKKLIATLFLAISLLGPTSYVQADNKNVTVTAPSPSPSDKVAECLKACDKKPDCIKNCESSYSKEEVKIDLFAPFANEGSDIFCRRPNMSTDKQISGDGNYYYDKGVTVEECIERGFPWQPVQRIVTIPEAENIVQAYVGIIFIYGFGLGIGASVLMIVFGGIQIIVATDSSDATSKGTEKIINGLKGLGMLAGSAFILHNVNPTFFYI